MSNEFILCPPEKALTAQAKVALISQVNDLEIRAVLLAIEMIGGLYESTSMFPPSDQTLAKTLSMEPERVREIAEKLKRFGFIKFARFRYIINYESLDLSI